jgi:hypothetical protein
MEDEEDPVVAEYDVYITPEIHEQIYVLQYLNRERKHGGFKRSNDNEPTELRVKEQSGFVEVDVPLDIRTSFNRTAGVKWGEALRKTKGFGQKAYGISSGFERVMPKSAPKSAAGANGTPVPVALDDDDNQDEWVAHFEDANEKGHVLNTQTFGGQIAKEDGKGPRYMLGAFKDSACAVVSAGCDMLNVHRDITSDQSPWPCPDAPAVPLHRCHFPTRDREPSPRKGGSRRREDKRAEDHPANSEEGRRRHNCGNHPSFHESY